MTDYPITAYFAINEGMLDRLAERAGDPGLDKYREYFYLFATPEDNVYFYPQIQNAIEDGLKENKPFIYEAKFEAIACINGINNSLHENRDNVKFLGKEMAILNLPKYQTVNAK